MNILAIKNSLISVVMNLTSGSLLWARNEITDKEFLLEIQEVTKKIVRAANAMDESSDPITLAQGEKWVRRHFKQGGK